MSFVHDLAKGKEAEKIFARKFKEWDIKMTYWDNKVATYEIKRDLKAQETWNFIIEYRFKWEASWIYASKADYIVYYIADKWWIQKRSELLLRIQQVEKRECKWWDGWQSSLYIIKVDKLPELFETLNLDEKNYD